MSKIKECFSKEIEKAMTTVSNHMDGEYEVFITDEVGEIFTTISKSLERFAVLKAVIEKAEDMSCGNLWEDCCEYDEQFEELYEMLEKIEKSFD